MPIASFFYDMPKLKREFKKRIFLQNMTYKNVGEKIGYTESAIARYFCGASDSRFITSELINYFHIERSEYLK